jgi:hypothetical protein
MKSITNRITLVFAILLLAGSASMAQNAKPVKSDNQPELKTYLIEREIPGAGKLSAEELRAISQTSCSVLKEMGPRIQWIHSYVSENRITCVYKAENEELIRQHAKKGGFPVTSITQVGTIISPATAQ